MTAPARVGPSPCGGGPVPPLTERDIEVLTAMATGSSYATIARKHQVKVGTAEWYGQELMRKLGAHTITHAVDIGYRLGLLHPGLDHAARSEWPVPVLQVLELIADGRTNADIARHLVRSEHTVADQVKEARRRLGARDRAHAAALAVHLRLVRVEVTGQRFTVDAA
ncbi:helix-turn-helix transcriptional regulator [Streptomyces sp. NPDC005407]|uniref:response regulator transcription factor n=1 Tax=Streptomyces sp. NPDC005407 TaxID=3155340 RepID=UPI0033A8BF6F